MGYIAYEQVRKNCVRDQIKSALNDAITGMCLLSCIEGFILFKIMEMSNVEGDGMEFTPLQVFSSYTLLKSTLSVPSVISQAKQLGYTSIALTDKHVMYGAVEFYKEAVRQNLKPLIGLTVDLSANDEWPEESEIVLIANNNIGYQELMAFSTDIMLHHQAVDVNRLSSISNDVSIIFPVTSKVLEGMKQDTERVRIFIHSLSEQCSALNIGIRWDDAYQAEIRGIQEIADALDIPSVISESVYLMDDSDQSAIKVLHAIDNGLTVEEDNFQLSEGSGFLKDKSEQLNYYASKGLTEALNNTQNLIEKSQLSFEWETRLPEFNTPENLSSEQYLEKISFEWLSKRVPDHDDKYKTRLKKELTVISKMGFADYFLIVWDLMKYAHDNRIATGSGRGSAAGSLVSYVLKITDVDPIKYDLLFDRFLNEQRFTLPDIDLDFPDNKREMILSYVFDKYGSDHVAQIATFGTFAAKMAIRDSGRVFGLTTEELKKWSNTIPSRPGITLKDAYKESDKLKKLVKESEFNLMLFKTAVKLEGLPRHVSTHAAGVVISKDPLILSTPLQEGSGVMPLTQFTMGDVETVGLLKMDFLGLKNLTILADCLSLSGMNRRSIEDSLSDISLDDPETLELFKSADTNGIFQFESTGIQRVLKKLGPTEFEDIVAVNALYRPGPMEQIDHFIARKKGNESVEYIHDDLKDILSVTYGVIVYQEQVMKVASKIAGYTLSEADILRRAISKKIKAEIDAGRNQFVAGAKRKGYLKEDAEAIYAHIERFANYGFNRSHAVSYSKLAFQLAYFKAHHPAAFYVALMRSTSNNRDKVRKYLMEAKQRGLALMKPSINSSWYSFTVSNGSIIFGLDTVKGLRREFISHIMNERKANGPYKDLMSFVSRMGDKWRKEQMILPLVKAGCFDELGTNRNTLIHSLGSVINSIKMSNGNTELFESLAPRIEQLPELSFKEKLQQEFEATGFYLSGHPAEQFAQSNVDFLTVSETGRYSSYAVQVEAIKKIQTKRGEPMAFMDVSDSSGEGTIILFPDIYRKVSRLCKEGALLRVKGKAEWKGDQLNVIANTVEMLTEKKEAHKGLFLRIRDMDHDRNKLQKILAIVSKRNGAVPVIIYDPVTERKEKLKSRFNVQPDEELLNELIEVLGKENVFLK